MIHGSDLLLRLWFWTPALGYLALIFHLSGQPLGAWVTPYPDYVLHAAEYFVLAVLLVRAFNSGLGTAVPDRRLLLTLALCIAYAASDEVHQYFVPGRSADYRDVLADGAGAALGLLAVQTGQRLVFRKRLA